MDVAAMSRFFALMALLALGGAVVAFAARLLPESSPLGGLRRGLGPVALPLAWLVAATCMIGSLYYSEVVHYIPCKLCWYQRIAMYPLAVILAIAAGRRDVGIRYYAMPLAAIGLVVAAYHSQLQWFPEQSTFCSVDVPCTTKEVNEFGFVTIPFMAFSGFSAILALLASARTPLRASDTVRSGDRPVSHQPEEEFVG